MDDATCIARWILPFRRTCCDAMHAKVVVYEFTSECMIIVSHLMPTSEVWIVKSHAMYSLVASIVNGNENQLMDLEMVMGSYSGICANSLTLAQI
jgi:hypothetical protein